jgi:DNA repair exonuclease SbcCD ATPase subunit
MRIDDLSISNFLSFREARLKIKPGLWFVTAQNRTSACADSNGSGKSALVADAPLWIIYGKTVREVTFGTTDLEWKKDDVINRAVGKDCAGHLLLTIEDEQFSISRYRKHSVHGNHVFLRHVLNGGATEELTGESDAETDELIEQLVGLNYTAAVNSIVFGQGPVKRFSQCSDAERRKVFESFFDLQVFNVARQLVKVDQDQSVKELAAAQDEMRGVDGELSTLRAASADAMAAMKAFDDSSDAKTLADEMRQAKVELASAKADLTKAQATLADHTKQVDAWEGQLKSKAKMQKSMQTANDAYAAAQRDVDDADGQIDDLRNLLSAFEGAGNATCPTCLRAVTLKDFKQMQTTVNAMVSKLEREKAPLVAAVSKALQTKLTADKAMRALDAIEINIRQSRNKTMTLTGGVVVAQEAVTEAVRVVSSAEQAKAHQKAQRAELLKRQVAADEACSACVERRNALQAEIARLQSAHYDATLWMEGFGNYGVKSDCYGTGVEFLNDRLAHFLQVMTNDEMHAQFDALSFDKIKLLVDIPHAADKYIKASSGQAKRMDLCIAMAFQSIVECGKQKSNISVFDEFDAALDAVGRDALLEFLNLEAERKGTCFVISHHADVFDSIPNANVLQVVYEDGQSKLLTE